MKKPVSILTVRAAARLAYERKKQYCKTIAAENGYAWNELPPYEALMKLCENISQEELDEILNRENN